jgi:hypothetical protein
MSALGNRGVHSLNDGGVHGGHGGHGEAGRDNEMNDGRHDGCLLPASGQGPEPQSARTCR